MEKLNFHVTGCSHYTDNFISLSYENDDYNMPKKELAEDYSDGDTIEKYSFDILRVELIEEPDNEYDPNAIRVDADGVTIGYIKSGACSRVKNLLARPDFQKVELSKIKYGPVKRLYIDDDDNAQIESFTRQPYAEISIYVGEPDPVKAASAPSSKKVKSEAKTAKPETKTPKPEKGKPRRRFLRLIFLLFAIFCFLGCIATFKTSVGASIMALVFGLVSLLIRKLLA